MILTAIKKAFHIRKGDHHFFLALITVIGFIFLWRGGWVIIDSLPYVSNGYASFIIGVFIVTFTGLMYREFLPEEEPISQSLTLLKERFTNCRKRNEILMRTQETSHQKHPDIKHSKNKKII